VLASPPPVSQTRTAPNNGPPGARRLGLPFASGGGNPVTIARAVDLVTPLVVNDAYVAVGGATLLPPPAGGRSRIYPATFYPSATSALQASIVALAAGEERTSVDIQLAPVPVVRVSGTVLTASGPEAMAQLHLVPTGTEGFPQEAVAPATVSDAEGNFVFAAVTPGQYTLRGGLPRTDGTVSMPIMVGSDDIDGVAVTARPALSITAAVQFDGNARPPSADDRRGPLAMPAFLLDPADQTVTVDQLGIEIVPVKGSYLLTGFSPGRYRVRVPNSPSGWMFKAALLNGVDVSEIPFDFTRDVTDLTLVFTDRWTSVGGTVQGAAADGAAVVAFPADASQWTGDAMSPRRFKTARVNARREFGMSALPPGDYYMAAVPEDQTDGWRDPSVLDALARVATRVTIVEGEHTTVGLPFQRIQQ